MDDHIGAPSTALTIHKTPEQQLNKTQQPYKGQQPEDQHQSRSTRVREMAKKARAAALILQASTGAQRNVALDAYKAGLIKFRADIEEANKKDIERATTALSSGQISASLLKRLNCHSEANFNAMLTGIERLRSLPDPLNNCLLATELAESLSLYKITCSIGVIAVVFEARPEAAVQIASLAMKSGNALLLKGGTEAALTNAAIYHALRWGLANMHIVSSYDSTTESTDSSTSSESRSNNRVGHTDSSSTAISKEGVPLDSLLLLEAREDVAALLQLHDLVDMVIPRGSKALVEYVKTHTKIPVLGHSDGLCCIYIDAAANLEKAAAIVTDSKVQYPAACNAAETLVVHSVVAADFLPLLARSLSPHNVIFRADTRALSILRSCNSCNGSGQSSSPDVLVEAASTHDFETEWLGPTLTVKVVDSIDEAIEHINCHSSHHTDCIVTEDMTSVETFMKRIDSAGVFHNCSTRFADGYRYGFGAEVGISTGRVHARGPVGLSGLLTYKYRLYGNGHIVQDFTSGKDAFTHKPICYKSNSSSNCNTANSKSSTSWCACRGPRTVEEIAANYLRRSKIA